MQNRKLTTNICFQYLPNQKIAIFTHFEWFRVHRKNNLGYSLFWDVIQFSQYHAISQQFCKMLFLAINEAVVPKKAKIFGLGVLTGRQKILFPHYLQQNHENAFDKYPNTHLQRLLVYFYPSDLVNTNSDFVTNSYGESWDSSCETQSPCPRVLKNKIENALAFM